MTTNEINKLKIDLLSEAVEKIMGCIEDSVHDKVRMEYLEDMLEALIDTAFAAGYEAGIEKEQ